MTTPPDPTHRGGDLLAIASGSTVLLWAIAYVGLAPAVDAPPLLMAMIGVAGLVFAGVILGRLTARGHGGGIKLGLLLGFINFIIVASLQDRETTAEAVRDGVVWIIGFSIIAIVLCTVGAWLGTRLRAGLVIRETNWTSWLSGIVAGATFPLIISGGIVTGLDAGLDVPDWLTTFGYPMMFYPMAMMQESPGVYAEHFHRLWGLLVGLSVILLVIHLFRVDTRMWIKAMSVLILLAVIVQGVIGAAWVLDTQLRQIAVMHGVFGQIVFSAIAVLAAFCSATWVSQRRPFETADAPGHRQGAIVLIVLLILQLGLGALYRHMRRDAGDPMEGIHAMYTHMFLAAVVALVAVFVGGRAWSKFSELPVLPRLGKSIMHLVGLQILLGIAALIVVVMGARVEHIPAWEVAVTTIHQAAGALLLMLAGLMAVWSYRLLTPT